MTELLVRCPSCSLQTAYLDGDMPAPADVCPACGTVLLADVWHPAVQVLLSGTDGNAFAVLGAVDRAMKDAGVPEDERARYRDEATSGDYAHLLATTAKWVSVY